MRARLPAPLSGAAGVHAFISAALSLRLRQAWGSKKAKARRPAGVIREGAAVRQAGCRGPMPLYFPIAELSFNVFVIIGLG
ncbi:MAG: hypothetical protein D6757_00045, partial [Alphaproteobacteria bacterium]